MRMLSPLANEWSWQRRGLEPSIAGDVFEDFDRIVNAFLRPTYANTAGFQPSCDVNETKTHYLIGFDMPGVRKEDIQIEAQDNQLMISGERRRETSEDDETIRHERTYGTFARTFRLPESVDVDQIEAHYENGVLSIALPKVEKAKGRTIQIQSGPSSFFGKLLNTKKESKELKDVKIS